jgi:DNA-binding winged helix-turn-helix (wHTH) protein
MLEVDELRDGAVFESVTVIRRELLRLASLASSPDDRNKTSTATSKASTNNSRENSDCALRAARGRRADGRPSEDITEALRHLETLSQRLEILRKSTLRVGDLELDLIERTLKRGTKRIDLRPRVMKLLEFFMRRPGELVTRDMLLEHVWNYRIGVITNVVDVHISALRREIDNFGQPSLIRNLRGMGFMLVPSCLDDRNEVDNDRKQVC